MREDIGREGKCERKSVCVLERVCVRVILRRRKKERFSRKIRCRNNQVNRTEEGERV